MLVYGWYSCWWYYYCWYTVGIAVGGTISAGTAGIAAICSIGVSTAEAAVSTISIGTTVY